MEKQPDTLEGVVESIIFKNEENGYTVARVLLDEGGAATLVGTLPCLGAGEHVSAVGTYSVHPQHGLQFQAESYLREMPVDEEGIYAYLASRVVKGVGPKTAELIVDRFGEETFDVLASDPERLAQVKGITPARAREIQTDFLRLHAVRRLLELLTEYRLPTWFAAGLTAAYGDRAADAVRENPFLLCDEPYLLSFQQADEAAAQLGIGEDDAVRLEAGIRYVLEFNLQAGHTFLPQDKLMETASALLRREPGWLASHLEDLIGRGALVRETLRGRDVIYLREIWRQEDYAAKAVCRLASMRLAPPPNLQKILEKKERESGLCYAEKQREAIAMPFSNGLTLITGGPGTGKTTALMTMIEIFSAYGLKTLLAAPTGRAAKRMSELCNQEAKTIHRLLEPAFDRAGRMVFQKNASDPLQGDVVVVDESSMLELSLATSLLEALPPHARLVLVGDADQLPPVGAGSFFADLLRVEAIPQVRLTEIFRQAQGSDIVVNAHSFNRGEVPSLRKNDGDFYFSAARGAEQTLETVVSLMARRIPEHFGIPREEIQVICPSRQGLCGTENLNRRLQEALNPPAEDKGEAVIGETAFRTGDRVMQIRNDYDRMWKRLDPAETGTGVYNGDTGIVTLIDRSARMMIVRFDDKVADYSFDELPELELAYAITAHKAQGSEYAAVVIPVFSAPQRLLSRNLLYTAVTRAKHLLVMVGREETVAQMAAQANAHRRYSALRLRVKEALQEDDA
ncbi:MAG: ATP-dependent RecD-like DNA helicase [Clostridia bacterium]|nr:ATP-dependent RecD-like DNA helicase [Clostridia bacterium]